LPNLIVLELRQDDEETIRNLTNLKEEPIFSQLPVLAVLENSDNINWTRLLVEDYIRSFEIEKDIGNRSELCIARSDRTVEINPLTRLPGNISISRQVQERLDKGEKFAFAYADLDHFKPFNDKYGFSRGDEVIRITGRIILNIVRNGRTENSFVGHIGGDDFVFITDINEVEQVSSNITDAFDQIIPTLYDAEDKEIGYIQAIDRLGTMRTFPIMTLSIGIADNLIKNYSHYGAMTEVASDMKKHAKQFKESCYKIDHRQN
jgi:diguanylate cyclase (GGDEF)-like protein